MLQKNDMIELKIEDMGVDGEGIGKYDGMTFFVKDAVIGDEIRARVTKLKKSYGYARVEEILCPSEARTVPECELYKRCGGCQIQAMEYGKQLEFKQNKVRGNLIRIGGFAPEFVDEVMQPIVGMETPYRYRNKAQFPIGTDKEGNVVAGFYAARSHNIIPVTDCKLGVEQNREILDVVLSYMRENGVKPYDEAAGKGLVRHVLIRYGFTTKEIMVCLVINGKKLPAQEKLVDSLAKIEGMTSISVNRNMKNTNVILGEVTECIWGQPYIMDYIHLRKCGCDNVRIESTAETENAEGKGNAAGAGNAAERGKAAEEEDVAGERECIRGQREKDEFTMTDCAVAFHISPQSFYQVNPVQTEKLYSLALDYAGLTGKETVWDLYCGIGTISLFLAQKAGKVYGVEIVPQAIEDAKNNAELNGISNAEFFVGKAEEVLPEFYERESRQAGGSVSGGGEAAAVEEKDAGKADGRSMLHPDVIVVDPPRKGCDEKCLETMVKMRPERIVYVSCDSATLARDLRVLCDGGYEVKKVRAVDQFGNTVHVETVVMLSHKKPDSVINVKVEFGEGEGKVPLDNIAKRAEAYKPKERVTYKMIKEYIEAKYGFKVHTAYIAEVERDLGLPMYDVPNAVEELKQPRKYPTAEKVEAIKDALKHFEVWNKREEKENEIKNI